MPKLARTLFVVCCLLQVCLAMKCSPDRTPKSGDGPVAILNDLGGSGLTVGPLGRNYEIGTRFGESGTNGQVALPEKSTTMQTGISESTQLYGEWAQTSVLTSLGDRLTAELRASYQNASATISGITANDLQVEYIKNPQLLLDVAPGDVITEVWSAKSLTFIAFGLDTSIFESATSVKNITIAEQASLDADRKKKRDLLAIAGFTYEESKLRLTYTKASNIAIAYKLVHFDVETVVPNESATGSLLRLKMAELKSFDDIDFNGYIVTINKFEKANGQITVTAEPRGVTTTVPKEPKLGSALPGHQVLEFNFGTVGAPVPREISNQYKGKEVLAVRDQFKYTHPSRPLDGTSPAAGYENTGVIALWRTVWYIRASEPNIQSKL